MGFNPQSFIYFALALLISLTIHEASHALLATSLGDRTAKNLGRLSLNPLRHLDPLGTIFLIVMAIQGWGIGWAKPVPVNPYNLKTNPKTGMAIVALAGPISNMVLAALFFLLAKTVEFPLNSPQAHFVGVAFLVNVSLAAFNLIPIPPLDGFSVLLGLLPHKPAYSLSRIAPYGPGLLLLLIVIPGILITVLTPLRSLVVTIVTFGAF